MEDEALTWLVSALRERALRAAQTNGGEGLRERKKRLTRQLISDTATALFLQRGFNHVRVAEVAEAAGVSEKTVFNYFQTKESLVLDREEAVAGSLRHALAQGDPVAATVEAIAADVRALADQLGDAGHGAQAAEAFARFRSMVEGTPELRAAERDMVERLTQVAAEALAARAGVCPEDPEPQIAATAIVGLWRVQQRSSSRHLGRGDPARAAEEIVADVRRAARLIDSGLWSFGALVQGAARQEELAAAFDAVQDAVRQVVSAVRQARATFRRQ
jgi:AcrR family transcriptional regulator